MNGLKTIYLEKNSFQKTHAVTPTTIIPKIKAIIFVINIYLTSSLFYFLYSNKPMSDT